MKAKDYYQKYLEDRKTLDDKDAVTKLITAYCEEVKEIAKIRHTRSDKAVLSILKEQNQKWNAMCRLDPGFKRDGFINFMKCRMPFLMKAFQREDQNEKTMV